MNQDDVEEKLVQISSRKQVYRRDRTGWVQLGIPEAQESVQNVIDLLPTLVYTGP